MVNWLVTLVMVVALSGLAALLAWKCAGARDAFRLAFTFHGFTSGHFQRVPCGVLRSLATVVVLHVGTASASLALLAVTVGFVGFPATILAPRTQAVFGLGSLREVVDAFRCEALRTSLLPYNNGSHDVTFRKKVALGQSFVECFTLREAHLVVEG